METAVNEADFCRWLGSFGKLRDGELVLEFARYAAHPVHKAPTCFFHMVCAQSGEELGFVNLRASSAPHIERYAGHIGYGVHPPYQGHHYAARSVRLLLPLARELKLDPLWITCNPENMASRRSCELAGARFIEIVEVPEICIIHRSGQLRKCRYRLDL